MQKRFLAADPLDALTLEALKEIKEESQKFTSGNRNDHINYDIKIPMGALDNLEETDDADYDSVPIEKFGVALLAVPHVFCHIYLQRYPITSATKGPWTRCRSDGTSKCQTRFTEGQDRAVVMGDRCSCQVIFGKNKGLYGTLEGLDGDTGRVIVRLKISKEAITVLQHTVRLVSSKEYALYSNCINQNEVDEYKAREAEQLSLKSDRDSDPQSLKLRSSALRHATNHNSGSRTLKASAEDKPLKCEPRRPSGSMDWLRPKLIVQCSDRNYCNGKYSGEKLIIMTVNSHRCSCKTESGQIIEGLPIKYLQTFIPHEMNSVLMIVNGDRNGQLARLIKRDSRNQLVNVKTRAGILLQYHFDSICAINDPFDN
ncbi:unnamed protein product [Heterobilharzia americana]|nr:unnamed protein product [Heterobilharzia americana]